MRSNSSCMKTGSVWALVATEPSEPRLGITKACMTERCVPPASCLTMSSVSAARSVGSGC